MAQVVESQLDARLAAARTRYAEQRPVSAAMHGRARMVMPGGNTRSVLHFEPFPFRVASAEGALIVDVDGHRYVDFLGNYTAGLLGHSPAPVRRALVERLAQGWTIGAAHPDEIRLAELICARFPSIEQVRFTNSGTEANLMAIATAVHVTGRPGVVVFEHGYHGGVLSFRDGHAPLNVPHRWIVLPYDDSAAVDACLAACRDDVACILVEPIQGSAGCIVPGDGYLARLRAQADAHGVLLIFDEVMTSRLHPGGAQALFGVTPDLTTLGKYLAGGMSFGAFGGSAPLMASFDPQQGGRLTQAGTFNNNVLSMAAGVATLTEVLTDDVLIATNARGDRLRARLQDTFTAARVPLRTSGLGSMFGIHGPDDWLELFFLAMLEEGHYLARRGFIALSIEITDAHVDAFCASARRWADGAVR
ncbi:MAG TPA: aspartate aminotransferase family protein [Vicinamibacterales bacterium]|nr:aspartate aminotransferase family protein [Vicinamibacterales bacterium]